ncbi:hypothetical protein N802_18345 [Knoellia sinensis KCTC 19936]|uniref:Fatty acid hydroxylase domain-containing protein n=1 Tax=Knoellia sinensis KCTC 19936 TaxID=1385520 RepID=A0A0A0J4P6_9MICO|nr:sterol desaturase family protein [Knoellia sinensis]KGN32325.1 hypothetical protein N802_18345 [Knoellia sinensis KCTC 19936]
MKLDLTVLAIPAYVGAMAAEYVWQRKHPVEPGTRAGDYEFADTMANLTMGLGSLIAPHVSRHLLGPVEPRGGKYAKALMATAVAAGLATTAADVIRRHRSTGLPRAGTVPDWDPRELQAARETTTATMEATPPVLRRITAGAAVTAVASTVVSVSALWGAETTGRRMFRATRADLGSGAAATAVAILGWDLIYYWNHRADHEVRWLWAMHVVHHSSERYNLSTALRQPVADTLTIYVPYGLLALAGVRPELIERARALNLIYQFWIHTEAVRSIGWLERYLNTPSHHRVHHGSNSEYLDRNHGSILIIWDKLFGTFEQEDARPVYGLTKNINTDNPVTIATHEWRAILTDIARSETWRDRWSFLLRGPGWAHDRRIELDDSPEPRNPDDSPREMSPAAIGAA